MGVERAEKGMGSCIGSTRLVFRLRVQFLP